MPDAPTGTVIHAQATITFDNQPPLDTAVTVRVGVARVPGEEKVDNNRSEYNVLFTSG